MRPFSSIIARYKKEMAIAIAFMVLIDILAYAIPLLIRYVTDEVYPNWAAAAGLSRFFYSAG
jgi:ABC-type bacteriocin/lantibiotic exporter with double-glycine peptidase domain